VGCIEHVDSSMQHFARDICHEPFACRMVPISATAKLDANPHKRQDKRQEMALHTINKGSVSRQPDLFEVAARATSKSPPIVSQPAVPIAEAKNALARIGLGALAKPPTHRVMR
jgi:hypothetical protein